MRTLLVVLAVSGVGCGGLDPQFAGVWNGTMVVTVGAETPAPSVGSVPNATVTIENTGGVLYFVACGSQGVRLRLDPSSSGGAAWSGVQSCDLPTSSCSTGTSIWRSATASLASGPTLKTKLSGTATSCGYTASMVIEFNGTK